jgi:MFS family permease
MVSDLRRDGGDGPTLLKDPNLHVVFSVTLMAMLGVASVTPAFPRVAAALQVRPESVGLLVSAFTFPGVLLAPALGVLADRIGRKAILIPSLLLFGLAGAACAFARDFELLVGLRLLQGVGGAALGAINLTLIGDFYSGTRRTTAMGYNSAVLSIGTAVYPAVGGALATVEWYWPFVLPIAAIPVALFVLFTLGSPPPTVAQGLGAYLRSAMSAMARADVFILFAAGLTTFVLIYGAYLTFLPFVLEARFGATPLGIGAVFAAASVATACTSVVLGRLARLAGEGRLVTIGFLIYISTMLAMPAAGSLWQLVVTVMAFGAANGIVIPSILSILAGAAPQQYRAAMMSVNGMVLRLGQTLGPVLAGWASVTWELNAPFRLSALVAAVMVLPLALVSGDRARA